MTHALSLALALSSQQGSELETRDKHNQDFDDNGYPNGIGRGDTSGSHGANDDSSPDEHNYYPEVHELLTNGGWEHAAAYESPEGTEHRYRGPSGTMIKIRSEPVGDGKGDVPAGAEDLSDLKGAGQSDSEDCGDCDEPKGDQPKEKKMVAALSLAHTVLGRSLQGTGIRLAYDESKHPRGHGGQWVNSSGGKKGGTPESHYAYHKFKHKANKAALKDAYNDYNAGEAKDFELDMLESDVAHHKSEMSRAKAAMSGSARRKKR